jgi:SAM-dependent methyltransferase
MNSLNSKKRSYNLSGGSPKRFGYSWNIFNEIMPDHETQFRLWMPFLRKKDWKHKSFLDVGCGIGRNSFWPLKYGAKSSFCIDVDQRTLNAAKKNLASFKETTILNQSIYDLNINNKFDIVFSIGVLHHLQYPELALRKMVKATKKNGLVLAWVYGFESNEWIIKYFNPLRIGVFSKMPLSITYFLSFFLSSILWIFLRMNMTKSEYFNLIKNFKFRHLQAIVFDHMIPKNAKYYRKDEAELLFKRAGLKNIQLYWVNNMSWAIMGTKT